MPRTGSADDKAAGVQDLRSVLDTALSERWEKFVRQAKKARSNPTEKAVHDLRVAMRRLLALLDIVKSALPNFDGERIRKQFKKHLKSLSDLRDTQMQILEVRQLKEEYAELSPFLGELLILEAVQTKRARKEIQRIDTGPMQEQIERLHARLVDFLATPTLEQTSRSILHGVLAQMYMKAAAVRKDIEGTAGDTGDLTGKCGEIHRLRLIFKRFRYTIEILNPILPRVSGRMLKRMNDYQLQMGAIQDTEVLMASISSHAKRIRKKEKKSGTPQSDRFGPVVDYLADRLRSKTAEFLVKVGELDDYWKRIN